MLYFNSRTAIAGAIIGLLVVFYNSKDLNFIGRCLFLRSVHTFSWFLKSNWSQRVLIVNTPKQKVEHKSKWFCGVEVFHSNFNVEWENGVWTKICFLTSGCLHPAISLWFLLVFRFFGFNSLLNGFPHPFIVHSRPRFC